MFVSLKQLSLSLCLLGLASPVWAKIEKVSQLQGIEEYRLENGLRVLIAPNNKETKVMLDVVYFTGSLNDPQGKSGLAHLLEHLAFKGTQNIKGEEFQRRLDKYTLRSNAVTNHQATRYLNVLRPDQDAIAQMLYLEAERMNHLVIKQEYVAPEIEIVKREREVRMDKAPALMVDRLLKNLYGEQSFGRMPIGSLEEIKAIQLPEIIEYYQTWYAPNNAALIITGKFDKDAVLKQVDETFSPLPAKTLSKALKQPKLNLSQVEERSFTIQKGQEYSTQLIYAANPNNQLKQALTFVPYLYSIQPTGLLYKQMVMTGEVNSVSASPWITNDFNIVYMGASYSNLSDKEKNTSQLIQQVEATPKFDQIQLQRAKNQMKNAHEQMLMDSSAVSAMLSGVLIQENGDWQQYFKQYQALQNFNVVDLNRELKTIFKPSQRLVTYIEPTLYTSQVQKLIPTSGKKQQEVKIEQPVWTQKDFTRAAEELKQLQQHSKMQLSTIDKKIERGQLMNGMKYAIFPTATPDQMNYATFTINFGDQSTLKNQQAALEMLNSLLLKGTKKYNYEQIFDKTTEMQGEVKSSIENNQLKIELKAPKATFDEYLVFVSELIRHANFDQTEFDVLKKQRLAYLQRGFNEPKSVSEIQMGRILEQYSSEDLRYHFDPVHLNKQYQAVTRQQLKQLHQDLIGMNHAQLAITGEINPIEITTILKNQFNDWVTKSKFERIGDHYYQVPQNALHVQSEPREFGSYRAYLNFPVGAEHADAAAMTLFAQVLGNSQLSSRLAMSLREKTALVYAFGSRLGLDAFDQVGSLQISADYNVDKTEQISGAVRQTFNDVLELGLTRQEIEMAKLEIMKQRVAMVDDATRVHRLLNSQLERDFAMNSRIARDNEIVSLTAEQVNQVVKKYINLSGLVEVRADKYGNSVK